MSNNLHRLMSWIGCPVLAILSAGCLPRGAWAQEPPWGKNLAAAANLREKADHLEITIRVHNYAEIPQQTVTRTKLEIAKIMKQAGVMTQWIDCPSSLSETEEHGACQERMSSTDLAIMILHKFKLPNGASRDTHLGSAEVLTNRQPGHYVYLSYDHIRDSVYPAGSCSPEILAEVAVHEIGHVLFRSVDHSPTGLMRARWDRQDFQNAATGNLFFTPQQA